MIKDATHALNVDKDKIFYFKLIGNGDYLFWDGENWVRSWTNHYYAKQATEIKR